MAAVRGAVYRVPFTLDGRQRLCLSQPRRQGLSRGKVPDSEMSRVTPQRRGAADETALPLTARCILPGCMERRPRRNRGGASVHGCCKPAVASGMDAREGGDGLPAPFTTARPDARRTWLRTPVSQRRKKRVIRISHTRRPARHLLKQSDNIFLITRTPGGGASARPPAAGPWPAGRVFAREPAAGKESRRAGRLAGYAEGESGTSLRVSSAAVASPVMSL